VTPEERAALKALQDAVPLLVRITGRGCRACGACCTGSPARPRPFLLPLEAAYYAEKAVRLRRGSPCPHRVDGRCSLHHNKPFFCAGYICAEADPDGRLAARAMRVKTRALKALLRLGVPLELRPAPRRGKRAGRR